MWMQQKQATWEAEGQVEERIEKAYAEGEQWRLANVARGNQGSNLRRRILTALGAGLAWLAARAEAVLPPRRGGSHSGQGASGSAKAKRSPAQEAIEATPDAS